MENRMSSAWGGKTEDAIPEMREGGMAKGGDIKDEYTI